MASANANTFPQAFGRYVLTQKIAMGGMAEIFRAKSLGAEGFEKVVVIKRILPHFSEDEGFVTMFKDEARVAAHLSHANVVQIFDFDEAEGLFYIAMEYVEGQDLKRVLDFGAKKTQPLSIAQAVHIIIEAALGLHYAHTRLVDGEPLNIVHRDVSPHNIMVSFSGEVKIMDFGIAKAASRSTKTSVGTVKGKCAYMSPEQARGKPLDARSDMFALGICLWEMLTGKRLFVGESDFETLNNVLKAEVPAPSELNPEVPKELDAIVLKALARDRDNRQADCGAFAGELRRWYYSTVADPDAASLKPYMHDLFAADIARIRSDVAAEAAMMEQLRRNGPQPGSNSAQKRVVTGSQPAAPGASDDRTLALDNALGMNFSAASEHTLALPDGIASLGLAGAGQRGQTGSAPRAKSRTGWYVGVGVGAAVLAAIAVIASGGGSKTEKVAGPRRIGIHIHAPGAQQILVDDNPICTEPDCDFGGEEGKTVKILARSGERMKIIYQKLEHDGATVEVTIPEPTTPTALVIAPPALPPTAPPTGPSVLVHVDPASATLLVNDRPVALKAAEATIDGTKLGDTLHVEAKAEGYVTKHQDCVVDKATANLCMVKLEKEKDKRVDTVRVVPAGPGKIVVNAKPWAHVSVKGKDYGLAPQEIQLPAGKYTVTLKRNDKTKNVSVTIKPGDNPTVTVDMSGD
jgi:tRNA A-37 threonylcarbamoyl transferase component Bud32